jgi:hypothetical protein
LTRNDDVPPEPASQITEIEVQRLPDHLYILHGFRRRRERPGPFTEWIWPAIVGGEWVVKITGKGLLYLEDWYHIRRDWETTDLMIENV